MAAKESDPGRGEQTETPTETRQVVEFQLGDDRCAIDIEAVDSIVEFTKVTRIPRTPDSIDGVMDLRGETTAVIDPRAFLGVDGDIDREDQVVLVLDRDDDEQKAGLLVDEVQEVVTYGVDRIDSGEDLTSLDTRSFSEAVSDGLIRKQHASDDEDADGDLELVVLLDVEAVVGQLE